MGGYIGSYEIDDLCTFYANTHTPATGAAVDADAVPAYRVYEDETGTPILTGSMALLDDANTVGFYSEQITLSAANGFEAGKSYAIRKTLVVGGVTGVDLDKLQIGAKVDVRRLGGVVQSATDLKDFADDGYDPVTNKVQGVVLTDTLTTYTGNTPQTGDIGVAGAGLTALGDTRLANLDALMSSRLATTGYTAPDNTTITTIAARLGAFTGTGINTVLGFFRALLRGESAITPSDAGGTFDNTTDSLEAIRNRGDVAWTTGTTPPTAGAIADAVWDETLADHQGVGSTGEALDAATAGGGLDAAGVRAAVGLASANLDTQLAAIVADTNELQTDWANGGRLDLILDARASQTSVDDLPNNAEFAAAVAGLSTLNAAGVRTAVGLGSANLDTQLGDIPTNGELAVALGTADDVILTRLGNPAGLSLSVDIAAVKNDTTAIASKVAMLPEGIKRNQDFENFEFKMVLTSDHISPATSLSVTATRSLDGGAFAACANMVSEISDGFYKINFAAADLNAEFVTFRFTAALADAREISLKTSA